MLGSQSRGLAARLENAFLPVDRQRGAEYHEQGKVRNLKISPGDQTVSAYVVGSGGPMYETSLRWHSAASQAAVSCSCARFEETWCKHLWALVLAADQKSIAVLVPGSGRLNLVSARRPRRQRSRPATSGNWRGQIQRIDRAMRRDAQEEEDRTAQPKQGVAPELLEGATLHYRMVTADLARTGVVWLRLYAELQPNRADAEGEEDGPFWCDVIVRQLDTQTIEASDEERDVVDMLIHSHAPKKSTLFDRHADHRCYVPARWYDKVLGTLAATGRLGLLNQPGNDPTTAAILSWDSGEAWRPRLSGEAADDGLKIMAKLFRAAGKKEENLRLEDAVSLLPSGLVIEANRISRLDAGGTFPWLSELQGQGPMEVPQEEVPDFVETLLGTPHTPDISLPEDMVFPEVQGTPRPLLRVRTPEDQIDQPLSFQAELSFLYEDRELKENDPRPAVIDAKTRETRLRDVPAETAAREQLFELGFRDPPHYERSDGYRVGRRVFHAAALRLLEDGWRVEADGSRFRKAGAASFDVRARTGDSLADKTDWFELHGSVNFGDVTLEMPALLQAVRSRQQFVTLGDGSSGVLPSEWLDRYAPLAAIADEEAGFSGAQVSFLDALLAAEDSVTQDASFERARARLREALVLSEADPPPSFVGELRPYQRQGLSWLQFLEESGLGGCLADDMGLGKTVQLLAFLEGRRTAETQEDTVEGDAAERKPPLSFLVVAPKSVVFNWRNEAEHFAPNLRVIEHAGSDRARDFDAFMDSLGDQPTLVLTTYGTLRQDIMTLREVPWDTVVLDEAQAIKNPGTKAAKSARLLKARLRLALTGTPVENRLGDLLSIFEFLNPGMLGNSSSLRKQLKGDDVSPETLELIARGLGPLILRRTKEEVLSDLPPKTEQILTCELDAQERRNYDQLATHYRQSLRQEIEENGLAKSRIQVLEALLRLRQAACHQALIDPEQSHLSSSKLDRLFDQLEESDASGHKSLVFSQFTSFLALVRKKLDDDEVPYAYLDGKTTDREACVDRFQNDPDCKLFLISLKAGGQGLNLTAADYVFLLDPWWNPAVEAQAIDRAHRIGQTHPVVAYRLIARDTVEEKILALQDQKKQLADTLIRSDQGMLQGMSLEDLEQLLG